MKIPYGSILFCLGVMLILGACTLAFDVLVTPENIDATSRYVTFTNIGTADGVLQDWHIDDGATTYSVPELPLPAGESINVWRGTGISDQHNVYLGDTNAYWQDFLTVGKIHHTILGQKAEVYYFGGGDAP
jgi:hypothetical protein